MIERRKLFASLALITAAVSIISVMSVVASTASAQSGAQRTGGNAMRISPVRSDLTIAPGSSQTIDVIVQNTAAAPATLHPVINDFTVRPDNETGQPDIILDEKKSAPRHSLKQYVAPLADITLAPNEQKIVKVVINIPKDTAGGGYYGAVRFEPASSNGAGQVSLSGSVGSLILVRVPGNVIEKVQLASFDVRKKNGAGAFFTDNKDLLAVTRFKNEGNVQVQPFGKITLKNQSGKVLAAYEINDTDPRGNVLPESVRRFETDLDKVSAIGKFTLEGHFGYGANGQLLSAKKTFYVIPMAVIIAIIVLIVLIVGAIFLLPRMIRAYNKGIIAKAARRR